MIEQALYQHLRVQQALAPYLATYKNKLAVFNQQAPADRDGGWGKGPQYGRVVFAVDLQGDPERIVGGLLSVDIFCKGDKQYPEDIEPIIRSLIHGYFFSNGTFTVSAQWKNSAYFTEETDPVTGCTVTFDLLAFPILTTAAPDLIARFNAWASTIPDIHVINHSPLPATAWKPAAGQSAVYWRVLSEGQSNWIPSTYATLWMTATVKGHIFSEDLATAAAVARKLAVKLYADRRLLKPGESPIMVNRKNTTDIGADPLRTGQMTVEATFGVIVRRESDEVFQNINFQ